MQAHSEVCVRVKPQPKAGPSDPATQTHIKNKVEGGWEKKSRRLEVSPSGVARIERRGAGAESNSEYEYSLFALVSGFGVPNPASL